jgi:hypothetical protein
MAVPYATGRRGSRAGDTDESDLTGLKVLTRAATVWFFRSTPAGGICDALQDAPSAVCGTTLARNAIELEFASCGAIGAFGVGGTSSFGRAGGIRTRGLFVPNEKLHFVAQERNTWPGHGLRLARQ